MRPHVWLIAVAWLLAGDAVWASSKAERTRAVFPLESTGSATTPRFSYEVTALEQRLFADAADGRLDELSLLEASLIASGVERREELNRCREQVARWVAELHRQGVDRCSPIQRAQAIFGFLHRRVLTGGYHLESTDLRETIDAGRYNCVTASILFNCLASELGLTVCGLENPGHAMSRVKLPQGTLDVETTCPQWFQLLGRTPSGSRPDARAALPAGQSCRTAREISTVELAAMVYYNRGIDLLGQKRFAEATAANAKALRLNPANGTARGNLLATLNNWAIDLAAAKHYRQAADMLRLGRSIDPGYEAFRLNYAYLCRQWNDSDVEKAGSVEGGIQRSAGPQTPE